MSSCNVKESKNKKLFLFLMTLVELLGKSDSLSSIKVLRLKMHFLERKQLINFSYLKVDI